MNVQNLTTPKINFDVKDLKKLIDFDKINLITKPSVT